METIPKNDCQKIGFIRKTHGVSGEVVLEYEPVYEATLEEMERFFIELDGLLVPFFIRDEGFRYKSGNSAIIWFKWIETEKYAKRLVGKDVFVFTSEIVETTDELSEQMLEGFVLYDTTKGKIGKVLEIDNYSGNVVFTVDYNNVEILVPFNPNLLISIDQNKNTFEMDLPEGLLLQD